MCERASTNTMYRLKLVLPAEGSSTRCADVIPIGTTALHDGDRRWQSALYEDRSQTKRRPDIAHRSFSRGLCARCYRDRSVYVSAVPDHAPELRRCDHWRLPLKTEY